MRGEAIHPGYAHSSYQTDTPITASIKHNIFISKSHIQQHKAENDFKTRMHSSRMRTSHSLTVCWRLLPGGGCAWSGGGVVSLVRGRGGVPGPRGGGWCTWSRGVVCLFRGGLASQHALRQKPPQPWCLVRGGGVPGPGGSGIPACTEAETPPPRVDRITDTCKNITLAQLRCGW